MGLLPKVSTIKFGPNNTLALRINGQVEKFDTAITDVAQANTTALVTISARPGEEIAISGCDGLHVRMLGANFSAEAGTITFTAEENTLFYIMSPQTRQTLQFVVTNNFWHSQWC